MVLNQPGHPYTRALIESVPMVERASGVRHLLRGELADGLVPQTGCVFAPRCQLREELGNPVDCVSKRPALLAVGSDQLVACHFARPGRLGLPSLIGSAPALPASGQGQPR